MSFEMLYCWLDRSGVVIVEAIDIDVLLRLGIKSGVGGMLDARLEGRRRLSSPTSEEAAEWPSSLVTVDMALVRRGDRDDSISASCAS